MWQSSKQESPSIWSAWRLQKSALLYSAPLLLPKRTFPIGNGRLIHHPQLGMGYANLCHFTFITSRVPSAQVGAGDPLLWQALGLEGGFHPQKTFFATLTLRSDAIVLVVLEDDAFGFEAQLYDFKPYVPQKSEHPLK